MIYAGKLFVSQVAQNVLDAMNYYGQSFIRSKASATMNTMVRELRIYKARISTDGRVTPSYYMTSTQKEIFECIVLKSDVVEEYIRSLKWGEIPGEILTAQEIKARKAEDKKKSATDY